MEANTQAIATLVHQVVANPQAIAIFTQRVEASEIEMHLSLGVMLKNRGVAENI